jgi:CDP-diglyceride synthetase
VFVPCFVVVAWRGGAYFVLLVNLLLVLGTLELVRMQRAKQLDPDASLCHTAALLLPWAVFARNGELAEPALLLLFIVAVARVLWRGKVQGSMPRLAATIASHLGRCMKCLKLAGNRKKSRLSSLVGCFSRAGFP